MLKFGFLPLAFLFYSTIHAQNLIANSGFEDFNVCSEFGAKCAPAAWFRLPPQKPSGTRNLPAPIEGKLYEMVVVEHLAKPVTNRIFLYSRLLCPLGNGVPYKLRFLVNPGRQKVFNLGVALTPSPGMDARLKELYDKNDRHSNLLDEFPPGQFDTIPEVISTPEEEVEEEFDDEPSTIDTIVAPAVKFVIPDIGFDFGKFTLNPTADPVLETCMAQIGTLHPSEVQIIGYTDDVGSDAFNLDLSAKRAMAVRNWFVEKHGLSPTLFVVKGLGESNPMAPNDTETGRQANRRVEINFVK